MSIFKYLKRKDRLLNKFTISL